MNLQLTTTGGYDKNTIAQFNEVASRFDDTGVLIEILTAWADDNDLRSITEHLRDRLADSMQYEVGIDKGDEGTRTIASFSTLAEALRFSHDYSMKHEGLELFIDTCTHDYLTNKQ